MTDVTRERTPAVFKGALPGRPAKRNNKIKNLTFFIKKNLSHLTVTFFLHFGHPPPKKKKRQFVYLK